MDRSTPIPFNSLAITDEPHIVLLYKYGAAYL